MWLFEPLAGVVVLSVTPGQYSGGPILDQNNAVDFQGIWDFMAGLGEGGWWGEFGEWSAVTELLKGWWFDMTGEDCRPLLPCGLSCRLTTREGLLGFLETLARKMDAGSA